MYLKFWLKRNHLSNVSSLQLVDISGDGFLSMMNDAGDLREDLKLPDGDIGNQIKTDFENGRELLVIDLNIKILIQSV